MAVAAEDPPSPLTTVTVPEIKVSDPVDVSAPLSANETLWNEAQAQLRKEPGWKAFEEEFRDDPASPGTLSMSGILTNFMELKIIKEDEKWVAITIRGKVVRPRDVLDQIVGYASDFKDLGDTLAGCDPTQSAGLAWGILQFFVTVR
jgi:hypothetical protein